MIVLVAALGILSGNPPVQATKSGNPPGIQLQEKIYPLTKPMDLTGEGIVLDGHGATLSGPGSGIALHISGNSHIVVKNLKITGFTTGIQAISAPDLSLVNVSVANCGTGVRLEKIAGGLVQGVQVHSCTMGSQLSGCTKIIFEKSDLSLNEHVGLDITGSSTCIVRDNKINGTGDNTKSGETSGAAGLTLENASDHNQISRNTIVRGKSNGIVVTSVGNQPSTENTFQGNDVSWTLGGIGFSMEAEPKNKLIDNTAGYCRIGFKLTKDTGTNIQGNLCVGNTECGLRDENGSGNTYDTNVFVQENGGPIALDLKGAAGSSSDIRLFQNVFMGFTKPIHIDNASPVSMQSNSFPWFKSVEIEDVAEVVGKKPLALGSVNDKPVGIEFVSGIGYVARIPTVFDRLGGVGISSTQVGDVDLVVEGSLTGAFQGEEEVLARFKGQLPVDLTFPPRFEMQVRVHPSKPVYLTFLALLGDNSMAHDMPADDSGDTLFKPGLAVDGDTTSPEHTWSPPKGKAGEWWEVDLKYERSMEAFSILPSPSDPNAFWSKFHVAVSSTGLFKGEEITAFTETNFAQKPGPLRVYRIPPITGRYIRIYGDVDQQGVQLQQFGVYGTKQ